MGAHLRVLDRTCDQDRCHARASVSLYNTRNEKMGDYCKRHGELQLRVLQIAERRDDDGDGVTV